ncbi:patatin-like phospholipase family protein [Rhizobacter sp. Root404]|jgi:predicted acylesterase/phospholipase RssA|uniref:patatin-like phospholipase family protein n=1 Tax=Rhizobacter sp. Root404 TaxID=1736528 RepID=UPI0006F97512|nr:patatin-like phospholipase family protein [Rhizobacter sp. Root404]KQW40203.1 patatin [Rhizobacter sp. Root404]
MTRSPSPRIGLALAGGGPLGAIYEIGALCALEESLAGLDFTECHSYVGVSAGGFIAAGLANGMTPRELCASFIENVGAAHDIFEPALLIRPAWGEFARRLATLPGLVAGAALRYAFTRRSLSSTVERLGRVLPTGLFSNAMIDVQLQRQFDAPGRTNDFRQLKRKLVLVATDLDSGESAPFGQPGFDHVPISKAVQASAALPGLFPPVEIDGHHYVDGALKKTLHASVLLDEGLDLLICLNPLVPFDSTHATHPRVLSRAGEPIPRLVDGGLPVVLSQTFRTLIHSRLEIGMKGYERSHPGTTIVLFEPDQRDPAMFLANTFSYSQRRTLAEHAYQQTRRMLRSRRGRLAAQLAPHGVRIDAAVLDQPRRLLSPARAATRNTAQALHRLEEVLDDLDDVLVAQGA